MLKNMNNRNKSFLIVIVSLAAALGCSIISMYTSTRFFSFLMSYIIIGLFIAWGISTTRKVVQAQARGYLIGIVLMIILWLSLRTLKLYVVPDPDINRQLWYMFYIPVIFIPVQGLLLCHTLGKPPHYKTPMYLQLLYVPSIALSLFVLANDIHQDVFRFPENAEVWTDSDFVYEWGSHLVTIWSFGCGMLTIIALVRNCRLPNVRLRGMLPTLPVAGALIYDMAYMSRVNWVVEDMNDFTIVMCLCIGASYEICMQIGLIQTNKMHMSLFRASEGLSAQITDLDYNIRYISKNAKPLDRDMMIAAEGASVLMENGVRLTNISVGGGHFIWTEDLSEPIALNRKLEEQQEELRERNALLQYEYEQEEQHKTVIEQNRLYDLLQSMTQRQMDRIDRLTREYELAENPETRRAILSRIVVLGSYIKRRKDFILSVDTASEIPEGRLSSAFHESFYALGRMNVKGGYIVRTDRDVLPGEIAITAYDFFEDVTELLLDTMQHISVRICVVRGTLRESIFADGQASAMGMVALRQKYPRVRVTREQDTEVEYVLPLEGGELK
ncbi:MAG: hypothetical protein K5767_06845 [Clostridia bacterium]|nr:hypothetical protein [Clostridia bacterium]